MQQVYNVEVEIQDRIDVEVSVVGNAVTLVAKPVVNTAITPLTDQTPLGANYTIQDSQLLDTGAAVIGTIVAGVDAVAPDATAVVKDQFGATITTEAIPSGTSEDIVVNVGGACDDGTAVLKDTALSVISSTPIPSGSSVDITAPDATAVLKDTALATLSTNLIKSGSSLDITAPDSTVNIQKQDSTPANVGAVIPVSTKSGETVAVNVPIADATVNLQKQDSTPANIGAVIPVSVKAEETLAVNVPVSDSTVNIQRKDTEGGLIGAVIPVAVKAEATLAQDIEAPDATAVLKNTLGNIVSTTLIKSNSSLDIIAADATVNIVDSAFNPLGTSSIPSNRSGQVTAPDVIITDSEGTPMGFLDALLNHTTTLLSGSTYTMSYADRNVPVDGILVFDRLKIQSPEFVLSANKSFTLGGTPVLGSEWIMLMDNSAGHDVTFSSDFDVFGISPTGRFTIYMVYHNPSGKVLTYMDQSGGITPPSSIILVEDDFTITPIGDNPDRSVTDPAGVLSVSAGQLQINTSSVLSARVNNVSYPSFVSTGPKSVLSSEFYGGFGVSHQPQSVLYTDSDNRAQIQAVGTDYRLILRIAGVNIYDFTTSIDVSTYPRHKIVLDHASGDVSFYYYNAGWVQMGTTQSGSALPTTSFAMLTVGTSSASAASMQMDNFSFCEDDYVTEFPV